MGKHTVSLTGSQPPSLPPSNWEKAGRAIGRVWKGIVDLPSKLLELIKRVSSAVKNALTGSGKMPEGPVKATGGPLSTAASSLFEKAIDQKKRMTDVDEDGEEDFDIACLFGEEKHSQSSEVSDKPVDPLLGMGAVAFRGPVDVLRPVDISQVGDESQFLSETYLLIQGVVEPAQLLMEEIKDPPASIEKYDILTRRMDEEHRLLKSFLDGLENEPEARKLILQVTEEIEEKMAVWGMNLVLPAQQTLEEVAKPNPKKMGDYWSGTQALDREFVILKRFASRFEISAPGVHDLLQETLAEVERRKSTLDASLCAQVASHYKPNSGIRPFGNCLFESIGHQLGNQDGHQTYRKQAVDYLRKHRKDYAVGIHDAMRSDQAQASMGRYARRFSKGEDWESHLRKKLGRVPDEIDYYLDCMENHSLWGGTHEILALSEVLQVPIIVFTRQDSSKWRVDLVAGQTKYAEKKPLMLYYNGSDHYQDLIPK